MKILLDFLALILFFVVYYLTRDIYTATLTAIAAGILQAALIWWKFKRLDMIQWVSLGLIVIFGGATVLLKNPMFIKWKPTLLFWTVAVALSVGEAMKKNTLKTLMGQQVSLPEAVWKKLTVAWIVFFFVLGAVNLFVAYMFSEETWVNYKVFGALGMMVVFFIGQGIYMQKYFTDGEKA